MTSPVDLLKKLTEHVSYTPGVGTPVATQKKILEIMKKLEELRPFSGFDKWYVPGTPFSIENCPKHKAFFAAGADYRERLLSLSNRSGKTISGAYEMALHLTGRYPSWWTGRRFDHAIDAWACGKTSETTRDTVQLELLGAPGRKGTGMIPEKYIVDTRSRPGVPNAVSLVQVRHVSGGVSVLGFKSYDQNVAAFTGTAKHVIWCDEEPTDLMLYSEMLMRTMSTNGIIYTTTTPIYGMTPFIESFEKTADFLGDSEPCIARDFLASEDRPSRALIRGGWDQAPWLTEEAKREILAGTPEHLREAKSKGIPSVGEGNVYQLNWGEVSCQAFEIPDYWKKWYALDVGWKYTAAAWFAKDPNTDITYVYDVYKAEKKEPIIHAAAIKLRGDWIAGVIDPASEQGNQKDGSKMIQHYRSHGLKLIDADNAREAGIYAVWGNLSNGKLKYFNNLRELQAEHMAYRRDKDGKILKTNDHLMDCIRYGVMSGHKVAKQKPVTKGVSHGYVPRYNL